MKLTREERDGLDVFWAVIALLVITDLIMPKKRWWQRQPPARR